MSARPGDRLGPYEVTAPLGAGGMGEVFRATDTRLGRQVAVKVLPAALAADPDRLARFSQEARAASALSHPNILTVFDVGTHEGAPYLVTELLEGETLRDRLAGGALPERKAVEVGVQLALGLAAAHEKGIVHRDLKPENVFLTSSGIAKILDFGLAKLTRPEPTADTVQTGATLTEVSPTQTGVVMGTVGYMAPEQARGLACDHRADVFALGCVLYEMLSGRRAFSGATAMDTMSAILTRDPAPLSTPGSAVVPVLQQIVERCLEKQPADRFDSAHDVGLALRAVSVVDGTGPTGVAASVRSPAAGRRLLWAGAALVLVAVLAGVGLWPSRGGAPGAGPAGQRRLAVLPFENQGAAEDAYFADGMTDEVRNKLTRLSGLAVIARGSASQYRGTDKPPRQIAEELGTPFLLTATVRWQKGGEGPSRIRVTPELVEVSGPGPATTRWQGSFDADLADVFQVQVEIATRVAEALEVALGAGEKQRLSERPTASLAAYDAYLRGQAACGDLSRQAPQALRQAIAHYEQAVALDPSFALAWAQLSRARSLLHRNGVPSPALAQSAREAAERALSLAPTLPEARWATGTYHGAVELDLVRSREEFSLGLASAPGHPGLLVGLTSAERRLGRLEEAREHIEQACALDPRSLLAQMSRAAVLRWLGRYPEALAACDRALALDPSNPQLHNAKAQVFLAQGDLAGARAVVAEAAGHVESTLLVAHFAFNFDLYWVLDDAQQELLLRLTPGAFADNRAAWALALAGTSALRGDRAALRRFAEESRRDFALQLAADPDNGELHALHGVALAYLGRRQDAVREGERAVELVPVSRDAPQGAYHQHQLVRIHLILGEEERAVDLLEQLLAVPHYLTPGWLSVDPTFAPLRGNPRFERLLGR